MPELSRRVQTFTDSVIRRMTRISDEVDAINLSQGFPDFPPPKAITDRLREVADELKKLKMEQVQAENGRVCCVGTLLDVARLNLNLRCGARVLVVLGEFSAISFEELYQGTYAIPWQDWIPKEGEFPV